MLLSMEPCVKQVGPLQPRENQEIGGNDIMDLLLKIIILLALGGCIITVAYIAGFNTDKVVHNDATKSICRIQENQ